MDSIDPNTLLKKLAESKIEECWFRITPQIGHKFEKEKKTSFIREWVAYGVPQGAVLSCYLFNLSVNVMVKVATNCILVQYADYAQYISLSHQII